MLVRLDSSYNREPRNFVDVFTTNENTTDGEILDRVYEIIDREDFDDPTKILHIRLMLEYAKETS